MLSYFLPLHQGDTIVSGLSALTMIAGWVRIDVGHRLGLAKEMTPFTTAQFRLPLFKLRTWRLFVFEQVDQVTVSSACASN